jgi:hypothetical protein
MSDSLQLRDVAPKRRARSQLPEIKMSWHRLYQLDFVARFGVLHTHDLGVPWCLWNSMVQFMRRKKEHYRMMNNISRRCNN